MDKPIKKMNKGELLNLFTEIENEYNSLKEKYSEIEQKKKETDNLVSQINTQKQTVDSTTSEIEQQKQRTDELYTKIEEQHKEVEKTFNENKVKLEKLTKQIEELLPGATSSGLASSYREGRKEGSTWLYWFGFIFFLLTVTGWYISFLFKNIQDTTLMDTVARMIAGAPLVWIAWYCQRSISQINRIKEEYHHKERIMRVFQGFSKQIDELTENNLEENKSKKLELISAIIKAIEKNPSQILDPSKTFIDSFMIKGRKKQETSQE